MRSRWMIAVLGPLLGLAWICLAPGSPGTTAAGDEPPTSPYSAQPGFGPDRGTEVRVAALPRQEAKRTQQAPRRLDVPFVPTPHEVVDKMLELAELGKDDVLYDLGCGDGRIVIAAAKQYGVKAIGIDIDPERVEESRANAEREGVTDLVTIKQGDLFKEDLSQADVVTMYLLPNVNERLMPQLRKLKPGSRIISHSFAMRGAKPERVVRLETNDGAVRTIYRWVVPWQDE